MAPDSTISPFVFAVVLLAAAMHAGWNAFLKVRLEPLLALALIVAGAGIVAVPMVVVFGWTRAEAWPFVIASLVLHLGYYLALTEAYRRGEMSQVYPVARGGGPLFTILISVFVLGEVIGPRAMIGVLVLGLGVALMALRRQHADTRVDLAAIGFALITGLIIAGYSVVDGIGARRSGNPSAYAATLFVLDGLPLPLFVLWRRGVSVIRPMLRFAGLGLAGGAMSMGAYWIAIWAMTVAPIAVVAGLRETSVLFSAAIATFLLKERFMPARGIAAMAILAGILLIRLQ